MRVIDIHTHGLSGYDTRTVDPVNILKIAELHGAHGVSDIVLSIYPGTIEEMRGHMAAVKDGIEMQRTAFSNQRTAKDNSRFKIQNPKFARIAGIHIEGPFLNPTRAGALDPASFQKPSEKTWKTLIEGFEEVVKIVTIAPELEGAHRLIKKIANMGIVVSLGHSDATYAESEKAFHAGAKSVTHLFNAMRGIHHREPGLAGFGLTNRDIYVEVIADPFHLHKQIIELIYRMKEFEKIIIVSDSVKGTKNTKRNQVIQEKTGTLEGGSMTITESANRLIGMGLDETMVVDCISANPLACLSLAP